MCDSAGREDQEFINLVHTSYDLGRQAGNLLCSRRYTLHSLKVIFDVYMCSNNDFIATEKCDNDPK